MLRFRGVEDHITTSVKSREERGGGGSGGGGEGVEGGGGSGGGGRGRVTSPVDITTRAASLSRRLAKLI